MAHVLQFPQTASAQAIQRKYRSLLNQVKSTHSPLFLLKNNFPEAVLIDIQLWGEMIQKIQDDEEKKSLKALNIFLKEKKTKKLKKLHGSLSDLM